MTKPFRDGPVAIREILGKGLLQIGAVEIRPDEPFTWSSGWKSPIYCDNRLTLSYPLLRDRIADGFSQIITDDCPGVDVIVGAATGGIAHAAIVADRLGLPTAYVRSSAKDHGRQRRIEGRVPRGASAIVIEDTLSTGASAYSVVSALQDEGVHVLGVCAILSYDFEQAALKAADSHVPAWRLVDYDALIGTAGKEGYVAAEAMERLLWWRQQPDSYGV